MRPQLIQVVLAVASTALLVAAHTPAQEPTTSSHSFSVFHLNSIPSEQDYVEIFIVEHVAAGWAPPVEEIELRIDGAPYDIRWDAPDQQLARNATFRFEMEAFDVQRMLTGHWEGVQVMECRFGGGAGNSGLTPDEMREHGVAHLVRCLDDLDDY